MKPTRDDKDFYALFVHISPTSADETAASSL